MIRIIRTPMRSVRPYLGELPRRAVGLRCDLVGGAGTTKSVERILWERVELNADLHDVAVDDNHLQQKDPETRTKIRRREKSKMKSLQ